MSSNLGPNGENLIVVDIENVTKEKEKEKEKVIPKIVLPRNLLFRQSSPSLSSDAASTNTSALSSSGIPLLKIPLHLPPQVHVDSTSESGSFSSAEHSSVSSTSSLAASPSTSTAIYYKPSSEAAMARIHSSSDRLSTFAGQNLHHPSPGSVPLSHIIERVVQKSYAELESLFEM